MNIYTQALQVGYNHYLFVNTQLSNPSIKNVCKYIEYKTWTGQIWRAEIIEHGNAFFHWQGHDRRNGHRDTVINYLLHGQRWQSTIADYIFFHSLEGEEQQGHYDNVIDYLCSNNCVYRSEFAEYISEYTLNNSSCGKAASE
ncbi:DUF4751 domain-containing protein [Citrobacter amalonaticus]|uniref:DUF4751 domain-containing protein n=1 Tax=Citrobacter amalonaticus TaxID=35703 RepID=A0A2S4RXU5_CITAM|nr:DUF4751 family protein [Citrobacter amalonaticus]POT56238.1 DUF4751 domain-containing protein [Citrobacter amalonaticus]POT74547.1 DUF4751 domain-containing protein [Citrobacter amalonaticus]POU65346.1 DUF4751 domain-containing protein [Citrobacter amalonaticus]POV04181.1 DUF4751 domain-containing protein [Citrobacter amalonaticus]